MLGWQSNNTLVLNPSKPFLDSELKRFIAMFMVRSSIHPLYTVPKYPFPIIKSLSKLSVAILISTSENRWHSSSATLEDCFALFWPDLNKFEIECETASIDDESMIRFNENGKWQLIIHFGSHFRNRYFLFWGTFCVIYGILYEIYI